MHNKKILAALAGTLVFGATIALPAEARQRHDRAANLAAMQMYAQQLANQQAQAVNPYGQFLPGQQQQWLQQQQQGWGNPFGFDAYGYGYDPRGYYDPFLAQYNQYLQPYQQLPWFNQGWNTGWNNNNQGWLPAGGGLKQMLVNGLLNSLFF